MSEAEKIQNFLDATQKLAHEMASEGTNRLSITPLFIRGTSPPEISGVRIETGDGRYFTVFAQRHAFAIDTSDQFHYISPWYVNDDPLVHIKKALSGFFKKKK